MGFKEPICLAQSKKIMELAELPIVKKWSKIWKIGLKRFFTADFDVFGEKVQNSLNTEIYFLIAIK